METNSAIIGGWIELMRKRKKSFNPVKQVKKLSRELLKTRTGKVIQSKKGRLLEKVVVRESRESIETPES